MAKVNIGKMPCETCANAVTVKQNENGTLSYRCDECDAAPYAKIGTQQNELWRVRLSPLIAKEAPSNEALPVMKPANTDKKLDMWGNAL